MTDQEYREKRALLERGRGVMVKHRILTTVAELDAARSAASAESASATPPAVANPNPGVTENPRPSAPADKIGEETAGNRTRRGGLG